MGREIKKALIELIDIKLKDNGSAALAIKNKDARGLFILAAQACVGEKETTKNGGEFVELCQKTTDNSAINENWCMSFIESMIAYVETKTKIISPIYSSEHCLTVWRETPLDQRVKWFPLAGAIVIWQHGTSEEGHTGIVGEFLKDKMRTIEGNTSSGLLGKDGVFQKTRSTSHDGDMKVVGYLVPFKKITP